MLPLRAALFVALVVATVAGQDPSSKRSPEPEQLASLLPYITDKSFQRELALSVDQVRALVTLRQQRWDEEYTSSDQELQAKAAGRDKAVMAVIGKVLSPDQSRRALQLAAQRAWVGPLEYRYYRSGSPLDHQVNATQVSTSVLQDYPSLRAALNLSNEQKYIVDHASYRVRFSGVLYLSLDQAAAAQTFLGPLVDVGWDEARDPRRIALDDYWTLKLTDMLSVPDVRSAIQLTAEQEKEWRVRRKRIWDSQKPANSPREEAQDRARKRIESEKALGEVLTPAQMTRLRQAEVWKLITDPNTAPFGGPGLIAELKLTPEQVRAGEEAQVDYTAAVARAVTSNQGYSAIFQGIVAAALARQEAVDRILTREQARALQERLGDPFVSQLDKSTAGSFRRGPGRIDMRTTTFGQYGGELTLLSGCDSIVAELALTQQQQQQLRDAIAQIGQRFPRKEMIPNPDRKDLDQLFADRTKMIGVALADTLTKDQASRFRQIMLQWRELHFPGETLICESAASYPGVAEAIGLTADQKEKLIAGHWPEDVLTEKQRASIERMLGKPFPWYLVPKIPSNLEFSPWTRLPIPGIETFRAGPLLGYRWDDLKLSPMQVARLAPALNDYQRMTGEYGPLSSQTETREEAREILDRAVAQILTPQQLRRLEELSLQLDAADSLRAALTQQNVAEKVKATSEQVAKMVAAEREAWRLRSLIDRAGVNFPPEVAIPDFLREQLDERILAVLSATQRATWRELSGAPSLVIRKHHRLGPPMWGGYSSPAFHP